jgi:hypothetical protein
MRERSRILWLMNMPSSFWSRTYRIVSVRVTLRLYFGEVKVSEFARLFEEAVSEFDELSVPHDSVVLTSNRAGVHFSNFLRMELTAAEGLSQKFRSCARRTRRTKRVE